MHFKALANFSPSLCFISKFGIICILIVITALAINLINELRGKKEY